jgi:hypothetical protein
MSWEGFDEGPEMDQSRPQLRQYDFHGRPLPEGQPAPTSEEPSELEAAVLRWVESLQ